MRSGILALTVLAGGCAASPSRPPSHEKLVNAHLEGEYEQVIAWCEVALDDSGADSATAHWCLFALPAALRLSFDSGRSLDFVRTVCVDGPTGRSLGTAEFRLFYVREVTRWFALSLRARGMDQTLGRALHSAMAAFSEVCQVDATLVAQGLRTSL